MFLGQLEVNECRLEVGFFFRSGLLVLVCSSDMLDLQQLPGFVYVSVFNTMVFRSRQGGCGFDSDPVRCEQLVMAWLPADPPENHQYPQPSLGWLA